MLDLERTKSPPRRLRVTVGTACDSRRPETESAGEAATRDGVWGSPLTIVFGDGLSFSTPLFSSCAETSSLARRLVGRDSSSDSLDERVLFTPIFRDEGCHLSNERLSIEIREMQIQSLILIPKPTDFLPSNITGHSHSTRLSLSIKEKQSNSSVQFFTSLGDVF